MTIRYTLADLYRYEASLNRHLAWAGVTTRYLFQRRNGYVAIDIYTAPLNDADTLHGRVTWRMNDCLRAGLTTREACLLFEGMLQTAHTLAEVVALSRGDETRQPRPA